MADGMRIDLSAYQPGAWAVVRRHTVEGYTRAVARYAREVGVSPAALQQNDPEAVGALLQDPAQLHALAIRYQVIAWQVADDDGHPLPPPREVTADHLEWVDQELLNAVLAAIAQQRAAGDAEVGGPPNPSTGSGASSPEP